MLRLAAGESLNSIIVRGVLRRVPGADFVTVQDAALAGATDAAVLAWAAAEGRALVTHDLSTMAGSARARMARGQAMPGLFQVTRRVPVGDAVEALVLLIECSRERE